MQVAEMRGVVKRFGGVEALRGIDLTIGRGELVALLGPNGAGKTTAVRILLGLARPTAGSAWVFGRDPGSQEARLRRGALLQVAKVPETLRVREHIELFSSYYRNPLPLLETVDAAGLGGLEHRLFGELSGGQKQRVLFALAICGNPDLLFLDEPTAGLDVEARRSLWGRIRAKAPAERRSPGAWTSPKARSATASRRPSANWGPPTGPTPPASRARRAGCRRRPA